MRSVLLVAGVVVGVLGSGQFDPQESVKALIEQTKQAKADLDRESLKIDAELSSVVGKPGNAGFVQLKSQATLASERRAFEERRSALIERNAKDLSQKKTRFNDALERLRRDSASLLVKKQVVDLPSSFIQLDAPPAVAKFFSESQALLDRVHKAVDAIKGNPGPKTGSLSISTGAGGKKTK